MLVSPTVAWKSSGGRSCCFAEERIIFATVSFVGGFGTSIQLEAAQPLCDTREVLSGALIPELTQSFWRGWRKLSEAELSCLLL